MKEQEKLIERLIKTYGNDVLRMAFMYLKDQQLAEDAFQEVFIKVYHKYETFRNESSEKTWLMSITINVCKDMLKSSWYQKVSPVEEAELSLLSDTNTDVEKEIDKKALYEEVLKLPEKYKDVILLYYYQGFNVNEIAVILDTSTGTVGSLLSRARLILKNQL